MSHELPLGKILDTPQQRDAIHIAVAPVVAGENLAPGDHVGFVKAGDTETVGRSDGPFGERHVAPIGIVDPFLTVRAMKGDQFWLFLYPQTITSLRHDWTHPAFEAPSAPAVAVPDKGASEKWLREYAEKFPGWSLERMLESAADKLRGGYGQNSQSDIPNGAFDDLPTFWRHYEIVTGVTVDVETRAELPFYCGC
jgi:hypothetical protein